jgi:hypothetical protein
MATMAGHSSSSTRYLYIPAAAERIDNSVMFVLEELAITERVPVGRL